MTFQSTVRSDLATGVVGDFAFVDGGERVFSSMLDSANAANNVIARAFTQKSEGIVQAGGTGPFAGLLVNPKSYAYNGLFDNNSPQLTLPNGANGEFCKRGYVFVLLAGAAAIGDLVTYNTTTGVLGTIAEQAEFTASQTTTVLTVTAITKGNLGVGSVVRQASGETATIVSLGTGTGGTGTYNLDVSQSVGSGAATATSAAPAGSAIVPNAKISTYTVTGAGIAVVELSN